MKTNDLNDKVDNFAMHVLLFVPFLILLIIYGVEKLIKVIFKKNIHFLDCED